MVILHTSYGDIVIKLDLKNTPKTASNFLKHAEKGFYKNTIFHRVMKGFIIQGGGFTATMHEKKKKECIRNEADRSMKNTRGTVAMARTFAPHSARTQFFINVVNNPKLDFTAKTLRGWGFCVFGKVVKGMRVVDKIKKVKTTTVSIHEDVPIKPIIIEKVSIKHSPQEQININRLRTMVRKR